MRGKPERIKRVVENNIEVLEIPFQRRGVSQYVMGVFICLWLVGCFFAAKDDMSLLASGAANITTATTLSLWAIGALIALFYLYRISHPSLPERVYLHDGWFEHDSGVAPYRISFDSEVMRQMWRDSFPKYRRAPVREPQLATLELREIEYGGRILVEHDAEKIEVGRAATKEEREWLYQFLKERYSLSNRRGRSHRTS
jgi:hypothetical protein